MSSEQARGERDRPPPAAIAVDSLRVVRGGNEVLPGLSFSIPRGSITGLLGPSGSGKTTLIRAIAGVQIVASGSVSVLDEQAGDAGLRSRVGYVTQAPSVYSDLTAAENLRYFGRIVGAGSARIDEVIETVGLEDQRDQIVSTLSGGQRARVSLATSLLGEPEILLLDEPTVGLDPVLRAALWKTFEALAAAGTTLLISSHVMEEASHCQELILLREGGIIFSGSPAALREDTGRDDLEEAFLGLIEREAATA
ncbi:MAG TPA: ABC transporter ATP-binding protein [Solirubrobacterales bacterium]|nr:ABC transporter ATP-binding protein [Solirubrobacterales bacterium]